MAPGRCPAARSAGRRPARSGRCAADRRRRTGHGGAACACTTGSYISSLLTLKNSPVHLVHGKEEAAIPPVPARNCRRLTPSLLARHVGELVDARLHLLLLRRLRIRQVLAVGDHLRRDGGAEGLRHVRAGTWPPAPRRAIRGPPPRRDPIRSMVPRAWVTSCCGARSLIRLAVQVSLTGTPVPTPRRGRPCPVSLSPRRNARISSPTTAGLPTPRSKGLDLDQTAGLLMIHRSVAALVEAQSPSARGRGAGHGGGIDRPARAFQRPSATHLRGRPQSYAKPGRGAI